MSRNWKWIHLTCPNCGKEVMPGIGPLKSPDAMVSPYPCWECEHPEIAKAERKAWEESARKVLEMAARGESFDAQGNPIPAIRVLQKGNGVYEMHKYAIKEDRLVEVFEEV